MTHQPTPPALIGGAHPLHLVALIALASLLSCNPLKAAPQPAASPAANVATSDDPDVTPYDPDAYDASLRKLEASRQRFVARFQATNTDDERARVRHDARRVVTAAIVDTLFPAWRGTPWGLGRNSTATRPHQPGMVVGCSYFVTSVLENAGLRLSNRYTFAQAPALHIQRALAPEKKDLHRFLSIPAPELHKRILALGEGLYIIGLNNHVGFVVVRGGDVRFVHASYTGDQVVTDEPLLTSEAIANSREAGYFVSPIFQDDRLIDHWLDGRAVPFQKLGM